MEIEPYAGQIDGTEQLIIETAGGTKRESLLKALQSGAKTLALYKEIMRQNAEIHVDAIGGDDETGDGSGQNPYQTIQRAISHVGKYDANGYEVKLILADNDEDNPYRIANADWLTGCKEIVLAGNEANPENCIVAREQNNIISVGADIMSAYRLYGATIRVDAETTIVCQGDVMARA